MRMLAPKVERVLGVYNGEARMPEAFIVDAVRTLVHALERTGGRYGMVTMCEGGGQANVTIIERA